ncbi:MAG: gliding motility-associated C-terminal domain-containing protein, partial [Bacteroidales bacterium]
MPNANAGADIIQCGLSATLQAQDPQTGIGTWILPPKLTTDDVHNPNAQVFASAYGTYTAIWEVVNGPCIDTSHVSLSFYEQPQVPDAGIDIKLTENQPIVLHASPPSAGIGTWSVISGNAVFSDINNPTSTVSNFNEGINILRWTIVNGNCSIVFDDVTIELKSIIVPEGFSPNGDGVNDLFVIQGIEPDDMFKLTIFNRWGNVVYEKIPYRNEWDGKDKNNNQLPDDTYFYILNKNNKVKASGYIILKR